MTHVLLTGPIKGTVTLPDGRTFDVNADMIEVEDVATALAISDAIGKRHEERGHPNHDPDEPFIHTPSSVTHEVDESGVVAPSAAFSAAVEAHIPAGKDSSPKAVANAAKKAKG